MSIKKLYKRPPKSCAGIVALSRQTEIILPPDTAPIIVELKRIGNNLNQIAAKVNSGVTYVPDLKEIIENQKRI